MKQLSIFIIFLFSFFLFNCSSTKKVEKSSVENHKEYRFSLSLQTKLFLSDLEKERKGKNLKDFEPTSALIEKYQIKKIQDAYSISGFIKINDDFNESDLKSLNIKINSTLNKTMTIIIPISTIHDFLELNGINYFEIATKVNLLKN